ncbi:hypothetical protein BaRGS_00014985 [Batillaria attramentaria]|uniref:SYO1-like TPR repeats domain-containing protein n=1 Tax=Batillaria attramentaria TaxID=370345 RepID=A0ABD0L2S8_9CAEN
MGKKKHKRFNAHKRQSAGIPPVNQEEESDVLTGSLPGAVAGVLEQLQSGEEATRECGCGTVAALALQPGALPVLFGANVVRVLAPLVVDPSPCVRHRALGALRNMTVEGGAPVCEDMVEKDVLTALMALFKQYGTGWEVEEDKTKGKVKKHTDTKLGIFTEAVHVLLNLCEASDAAVNAFNRDKLLPDLLPCLQYSMYGYPLATVVAQCLHTVTEGNQEAVKYCRRDSVLPSLLALVQQTHTSSQGMLFQATLLGILSNVLGEELLTGPVLGSAVAIFKQILEIDVTAGIVEALGKCEQNGVSVNGGGDHESSADEFHVPKPDSAFSDLVNVIDSQRLCIELITNMCCSPDDDWEDVDSSGSGSSDELVADVDMEQDNAGDSFNPLCVPSEVHAAFIASDIVAKVVKSSCPIPAEMLERIKARTSGKQVLSKLTRLRTSALLCINNMVDAMETDALGGIDALHHLWDALAQQVQQPDPAASGQAASSSHDPSSHTESDLLEAMTSAMRAIIQKLVQLNSPKFAEVSSADVQFLVKMAEGAGSSVQVHIMRTVAAIATLLVRTQPEHNVVQDVGSFLVTVAGQSHDLVVVAEALDALFDVFSDDATDPVARRLCLTERLTSILPQLKAKVQSQRKSLGENYITVSTSKTNLIRFIKYKESTSKS